LRAIRFALLVISKLLLRYKFKIILVLVISSILTYGIYSFVFASTKSRLSEGIVGTFTENDLPPIVTQLVSKGLVEIDKTGSPSGQLAKEWTSNDQSTEYWFKLKDDLYWSDGTKLKAADLPVSIPNVEITTPDDRTMHFKLSDSYSPFPSLLTKPLLKKNTNIGIGPYQIAKIYKDGVFVKKLQLHARDQALPDVTIHFYPNERIAKTALRIGEVASILGINDPEDLTPDKSFNLFSQPSFGVVVTIFYNTEDPVLSDENLRLALSYSAPSIPNETEARTSLSPQSWAFNNTVKDYLDNQEGAKNALAKVKNKDLVITLTATSSLKNIGEQVIASWKKAGIKAVLRTESGIPQNFQALLIAQKIPADPDQYSLWHKLGQTNISKFSNPRMDKDLEDGRKLKDISQRRLKYADFQKVLLDHSPASFLYFPKYNVLYLKKVEPELKKVLELQILE